MIYTAEEIKQALLSKGVIDAPDDPGELEEGKAQAKEFQKLFTDKTLYKEFEPIVQNFLLMIMMHHPSDVVLSALATGVHLGFLTAKKLMEKSDQVSELDKLWRKE